MNPKKTDPNPRLFVILIIIVLLCFAYPTVTRIRNNSLAKASLSGDAATAKVMLSAGADPNTSLLDAITRDHPQVVEELLTHGADVNRADSEGGTPLTSAIIFRKLDIIPILLKHGADFRKQFPRGGDAFVWAAMNGDTDTLGILADYGADVNEGFGPGFNAMMLAAQRNDVKLAEILFKKGADVNKPSPFGSALMAAVDRGQTDAVRFLVSKGADVNKKSPKNQTAVPGITNTERFMQMGGGGGASKAPVIQGDTPLMHAVSRGDSDIAEMLIEHHADINAKDAHGRTALSMARSANNQTLIQLLRNAGAKG